MTITKKNQPTLLEYETFLNHYYKQSDKAEIYDKFVYLTDSSREKPIRIDRFNVAIRTNTMGTILRKYDFEAFKESFEKDKIPLIETQI